MLKKEVADKLDAAFAAHAKRMEQIQQAKQVKESKEEAFVRAFGERRSALMKPVLEQIAQHLESKGMRTRIEETDESYGRDGKQEKQSRILMSFEVGDSRPDASRGHYASHERPYLSMSADKHSQKVTFRESTISPGRGGYTSSSPSVNLDELTEELIQERVLKLVTEILK